MVTRPGAKEGAPPSRGAAVIALQSGSPQEEGRGRTCRDTHRSTSPRQPGNKDTHVRTETRDNKRIYNERMSRMSDKMCYNFDVGDDIVRIE